MLWVRVSYGRRKLEEFVLDNDCFQVLLCEPLLKDLILTCSLIFDASIDYHLLGEWLEVRVGISRPLGADELLQLPDVFFLGSWSLMYSAIRASGLKLILKIRGMPQAILQVGALVQVLRPLSAPLGELALDLGVLCVLLKVRHELARR